MVLLPMSVWAAAPHPRTHACPGPNQTTPTFAVQVCFSSGEDPDFPASELDVHS